MSAKNCDGHNRFRSETIGFRVSPEENAQINVAVALSGLTKQDYITNKLLDREIVVRGNCKIHKAIFDQLSAVLNELQRIEQSTDISDETHDNIRLITSVIEKLYVPEI